MVMLTKQVFKRKNLLIVGLGLIATIASCSKKDSVADTNGGDNGGDGSTTISKYVVGAVNGSSTYFISVNSLDTGSTTIVGNGIEDNYTYTHYAYNGTKGMIALNYQQGDPAVGKIYELNSSGVLAQSGASFQLTDGFNSLGPFSHYIVTAKNSATLSSGSTGTSFYFVDLNNNAAVSNKGLATTGLFNDPGRVSALIGIVDAGDGNFISAAWPADCSPDSCFAIKLDSNLNVIQKYTDNRIGYASGSYRSARYSLIANDDDGNTYVFASPIVTKTKNAGALKIAKGANTFDQSYYFDIESLSGGYLFRKVYHVSGSNFLLEFYSTTTPGNTATAYRYAIVNTANKTFSWVTGLPSVDDITNVSWGYSDGSKAYLGITTTTAAPTIYVIDPATAIGKAGLVIAGATSIGGIAHLEN
ncbi:MAG: hypothetical protein DI598_03035 [Pseudopedobacter saltans]|uniref:DUF4374 domain-containing protein n=1 Tax=Pseudopedobacter saltans TaxID=151895 RepID=A0A2W5HCV7_9SPHI|nr:MAG: hypothetical protein DI598_03035 [Pseudopedobacter saltans]